MKKLFLTSEANVVIDKIIELLPDKPKNLRLAFIPTAADPYEDKSWLEEDRQALIKYGFNVINIDLKNKTKKALEKELKNIDIIFVAGGNTFYLLEKANKSGFTDVIRELVDKGTIYIGSSAGTVLASPDIGYIKELDEPQKANLSSYKGLNLVDFSILVHWGEKKYKKEYLKLIRNNYFLDQKTVLLTNKQAILVWGDKYKII